MPRNFGVIGRPYVTSMQAELGDWYPPFSVGEREEEGEEGREAWRVAGRERSGSMSVANLLSDAQAFGRGFVRFFAILGSGEVPLILGIPYHRHDFVALREASLGGWVAATLRNRSSPLERALVVSIAAYLAVLYLAAARGLLVSARRRKWVEAALLLATIGYFMVATGPIAREIRYRLPALPAIVLFAALGLSARGGVAAASRASSGGGEVSAQSSRSSSASSSRSAARRSRVKGTPERSAISSREWRPSLWLSTHSRASSWSRLPEAPPIEP
jgi:hypothetical protein